MNSFIKNLICAQNNFYKKFVRKTNNMHHLCPFKTQQNYLNQSIQIAKQNYVKKIAQRLGDPNTSSKCHWSLLKTLLNGKKIRCIPPLFHDYLILLIFKKKVKFSILFSLTNDLRFQTQASYFLNYHYIQIAHYLLVTLQKMRSFE